MENTQPLPNQQSTEISVQPQVKQNNSRLFVVIVISVLLTAVTTGSVVYFWQKSTNEEAVGSLEQKITSLEEQISTIDKTKVTPQQDSSPVPSSTSTTTRDYLNTYSFSDFNLSFDYPEETLLEKVDRIDGFIVTLSNGDSTMTIKPNQVGLGFENPDIEMTQTPLKVNGEQLQLAGTPIEKTKLFNKVKNETSYLIIVPYPDQKNYSIMITYSFEDGIVDTNSDKLFDQVLSTFEFTN